MAKSSRESHSCGGPHSKRELETKRKSDQAYRQLRAQRAKLPAYELGGAVVKAIRQRRVVVVSRGGVRHPHRRGLREGGSSGLGARGEQAAVEEVGTGVVEGGGRLQLSEHSVPCGQLPVFAWSCNWWWWCFW